MSENQGTENPPSQPAAPSRTPLYTAGHAPRYTRQGLIKEIEQQAGATVLCYVANGEITRDDLVYFMDLLYNVRDGSNIDLLLHTPGGDVDAAEKLISLLRAKASDKGKLRAIIPDFAKSAGTLIALGADVIVMSDSSELGTIDPQIAVIDAQGNEVQCSVLDYLGAYYLYAEKLRANPEDPVARAMFGKLDPALVHKYEAVKNRARTFAEKQLLRRAVPNWTQIVTELMDTRKYPSHSQMIGWSEATQMGLKVDRLDVDDPLWRAYWQLYCHYRLAVAKASKIFETAYASHEI